MMVAAAPGAERLRSSAAIIGVNYGTDGMTLRFLDRLARLSAPVTVIVVDNSEGPGERPLGAQVAGYPGAVYLRPERNLGYFGGAQYALAWYRAAYGLPDWVVVSNVDVEIRDATAFLAALDNLRVELDVGVVGPRIRSNRSGRDLNPMMLRRPPRLRMHFYKHAFRNPITLNLYELLSISKDAVRYLLADGVRRIVRAGTPTDRPSNGQGRPVYAVQGSCLVFSRLFFERGGTLTYPVFLFGEEVFVAETARRIGLQVLYCPALSVWHDDHSSTGRFRSARMARYVRDSAIFLADQYFT